ncbi:hypothetical protein ACFQ45_02605 [Rhodanobacter aciditrophus]|uniref:Lipoprotein n=1 Tax=Rhodanobacter aciditrophus TaxID=1623218 RepID=A0ABW4B0V1_9GAMM
MKFSILALATLLLSGCGWLSLNDSEHEVQEAYYVPVIRSDSHSNSQQAVRPVQITDRELREGARYVPRQQ